MSRKETRCLGGQCTFFDVEEASGILFHLGGVQTGKSTIWHWGLHWGVAAVGIWSDSYLGEVGVQGGPVVAHVFVQLQKAVPP